MCASWNRFGKRTQNELAAIIRDSDKGNKEARKRLRAAIQSNGPKMTDRIAKIRVQMYSRAAYEGDEQAQYWMGVSLAKLGNKEVSLEWLTGLAKKGNVKAMKAIARGYAPNGAYGDKRDEHRLWVQKAAEAQDAQSQADMGLYYATRDAKISRYWFLKSARQNWPMGCLGLGKSYYNEALQNFGDREEERRNELMKKAERYFLKAANLAIKEEEFAAACHELGAFYEFAMHGERFADKAAYFYYQAWHENGREEDLAAFERIRDKYRLEAETVDMEAWEARIFGGCDNGVLRAEGTKTPCVRTACEQ